MTPYMNATRSWGSTGYFLHWLLDKRPAEQQAPPQHKSTLDNCGQVGLNCYWSISPLSELQVPRAVAVYGNVYQKETGVLQAHSRKGIPQSSAKARGDVLPIRRQTRAMKHAPVFPHFHFQMAITKQRRRHEVCAWACLRWQNHAGGSC